MISIVVETWNLHELDPLRELLAAIERQRDGAELIVTHAGIPSVLRRELGEHIAWIELDSEAGYYDHKNRGFAAAHGEIVAFIDGDCSPSAAWLAELTRPIIDGGARVVAGHTSYRGELAALASQLDFPYFTHDRARGTVRNFFANNVAFARDAFTGYPDLAMFHGQCQVLGLELLAANIAIHHARDARVIHAWPDGARAWLEVRLLRGADTAALLPYILRHYTPRGARIAARLGRLPALAVLAARAVTGTVAALRNGPRARGLALVAGITIVDAIGCAAGPAVYRAFV